MQNTDTSKSRVTKESVGLLLFALYPRLKNNERVALNKFIEEKDLPVQPMAEALKDAKIIENGAGKGPASQWKWLPVSGPNDVLINRVFDQYHKNLQAYREKMQKKSDDWKGINRKESGPAKPVPPVSNVYLLERVQLLEDRTKFMEALLLAACQYLEIKETCNGLPIIYPKKD